jgi:CARMIL C-terminus
VARDKCFGVFSGDDKKFKNVDSRSEDRVTDLPPSSVLQHLGKARPKRAKKYAPSRGAVAVGASGAGVQPPTSTGNNNNNDNSIDDGVDSFYPASFNSSGFSSPSSANRFGALTFVPPTFWRTT